MWLNSRQLRSEASQL